MLAHIRLTFGMHCADYDGAQDVERVYAHRLGGAGTAQPAAVADLLAGERKGCKWFTKRDLAVSAAEGKLAAKGA
jgi:hypothetical protein